jgi:DNA-binding NtrC family response regulator
MLKHSDVHILLVDDEAIVREAMASWLTGEGYHVHPAPSGEEALVLIGRQPVDIALIDLKMPGMNGVQVIERLRALAPDTLCLIVTAHGTVESAVEAMRAGAYDYITKPFNPEEVSLAVERVSAHLRLIQENKSLKAALDQRNSLGNMVSRNEKMLHLFEVVRKVAKSRTTVLILGESGTGKELLARAIHSESPRKHSPFVAVSCAALSETLLEDEIFGHEKGAFTDAREARPGKFEQAHQGTLFLDEIGDISSKLQLDLLRVIQEREFTRLGGNRTIRVDVRLISATNRDIEKMVLRGEFRDDLFYRLNIISLTIPPLRERREDIVLLIDHFLRHFAQDREEDTPVTVSKEAMKLLLDYSYPGNVRELEGAIEHAVILCRDRLIRPQDLPARIREAAVRRIDSDEPLSLEEMERRHIARRLEENDYRISQCSRLLGIDRSTLYLKMQKYGLKKTK